MKVVIMAGGKGTRISSISSDIPKPMIKVGEKPVLQHQIECLRKQGLRDIILVIGHLGDIIESYFKDGAEFGVNIDYYRECEPLGTAGALYYLKDKLSSDFILMNGDIILDIDFERFIKFHNENGADVTLFTHPNSHPYDSALIVTNKTGKVVRWIHKEEERGINKNRVNAGVHILSNKIIEKLDEPKKLDLDRDVLKPLVSSGKVYAYDSPEYIKDMGTPERYWTVCEDYKTGKIAGKNLREKQKAIFLDRDGTINEHKGFINNVKQIKLIEGVAEAIKKINESGYLAIVVTNQPVIARGECSFEELENIHNKIETELGEKGAYIDDIFFCPHHPHSGFENEKKEFKVICDCRKPKPGMLFQAAEKYNIDLSQSYMVGDSKSDIEAGSAAGCKTVLLSSKAEETKCTFLYDKMLDFVEQIITKEKNYGNHSNTI